MRTGRRCQPDLFQTDPPPLELLPEQRDKLMALLQVLLLEAAAERTTEKDDRAGEETGDDKDRA